MSLTVTGVIEDFYENSTKQFNVTFTKDGEIPDILLDEVRVFVKENKTDTDADAKINKIANVANQGAVGIAEFVFTPDETKLTPGKKYFYQIVWTENTGEKHALPVQTFKILDAIYEVT